VAAESDTPRDVARFPETHRMTRQDVPGPPSGRMLRGAESEVEQMHNYISRIGCNLHEAIRNRDADLIRSYHRALHSGIARAHETTNREAGARGWDPSEGQGGRYSRPGSSGRNARVMAVMESRSADRKKVRFPPPKAWDLEAKWTQDCVMFRVCGEKHVPGKCDAFKKLSPQQRLKEIDNRELCRLCYRHLRRRDCWSKDKVPNCGVDGCEAAHHHLLHGTLVEGRVMVVQGIGARKARVFLCREDVRVEGAGKASRLHTL
jgi:hypothetical protein